MDFILEIFSFKLIFQPSNYFMEKEKNTWVIGIIDLVSLTLEPFLRKDFGERYFTILKFVLSGLLFLVYFGAGISVSFQQSTYNSYRQNLAPINHFILTAWLYIFLIPVYFWLGIAELKSNFHRNKNGQRWHTYNSGTSRFSSFQVATDRRGVTNFLGQNLITPFVSQLYVEPLLVLIISLFFFFLTNWFQVITLLFLPCWLLFASIFMFIKGQIMYNRLKNQVLNARDSQIEGDFMEKVISGELTRPQDSDGLTAISLRPQTSDVIVQTTQEAIKRAMEKNPRIGQERENERLDNCIVSDNLEIHKIRIK